MNLVLMFSVLVSIMVLVPTLSFLAIESVTSLGLPGL